MVISLAPTPPHCGHWNWLDCTATDRSDSRKLPTLDVRVAGSTVASKSDKLTSLDRPHITWVDVNNNGNRLANFSYTADTCFVYGMQRLASRENVFAGWCSDELGGHRPMDGETS